MEYKHVISLGYFCSVALEIEKLGLRDGSYPFDWQISSWVGVEQMIRTHFDGYLDYENLAQLRENPNYYKNTKYDIAFFHDFTAYKPLKDQLTQVQDKYKRRIDRFYKSISEPTLFIRYISSEKGTDELEYIEHNIEDIYNLIKSFNDKNEIIWISNNDLHSDIIKLYSVEKDDNDCVARNPVDKNEELKSLLDSIEMSNRSQNLAFYIAKKNSETFDKVKKKLDQSVHKILSKPYVHENTI